MHLICPACGAKNRVPAERLSQHPVCGKCAAEIAPHQAISLNDESIFRYLEHTEAPVVVDCWAAWCGPCKSYAPQFAQVAQAQTGLRFVKMDSDANPGFSARYSIRSIPTTLLFQAGQEIARISGALSAAQLQQWLQQHLHT